MRSVELVLAVTLLAAKAHYFFLDEKVTKNQVSKNASFAAQGLCPAAPLKPRAVIIAAT
jgi:hypothetical protein